MHDLMILGAGGHGRTLYETAKLLGYYDIVYLDDQPSHLEDTNKLIVGKIADLHLFINKAKDVIVGIGNNKVREQLLQKITCSGAHLTTLIHPTAIVSSSAAVGHGSVIMAGAVIGTNTRLGTGVIVNSHSTVDHDSVIGDFAHLGVGVHLAGNAEIGKSAFLQAGTVGGYNAKVKDYSVCPAGTIL